MSIFNDKYYEKPEENAFLNWRTDAPSFSSFYTLGAGFLSQSFITLQTLFINKNEGDEADSIIFPIMFSLWHGIELMLKSGIKLCREIQHNNEKVPGDHQLKQLFVLFIKELKKFSFIKAESLLKPVKNLIQDFENHNVNFDAFRYPVDSDWNQQFYNKPDDSGFVENIAISLKKLEKQILEIIDCLPIIIRFIENTIIDDGNHISMLNNNNFINYKNNFTFKVGKDYDENEDKIIVMLRLLRYRM